MPFADPISQNQSHPQTPAAFLAPKVDDSSRASAWHVVFTHARHEKAVAKQLAMRQIDYLLPLYDCIHRWNDRRVNVSLPLFPSYVFVRVDPLSRLRVLTAPGVIRIVSFNGAPAIIPDAEIDALSRALAQRRAQPCAFARQGQRVRICAGPLQGLEGHVLRTRNQYRVVVSVDFISRSVALEVSSADLESAVKCAA